MIRDFAGSLKMEEDSPANLGNATRVDDNVIETFRKSFVQVQSVLDQNRLLINEINHNHESKIADNLTRNVGLIRELNSNIRRVVGLYADLSVSVAESAESTPPPSEGGAASRPRSKRNRQG